jgi:uncharacterized membrane protein
MLSDQVCAGVSMMRVRAVCAGLAAAVFVAGARGQASFVPLGDLPGGWFYSDAFAVSADGLTVAGSSVVGGSGLFAVLGAYRWAQGAMLPIYPSSNAESSYALAASGNGQTLVGYVDFGFFSTMGTQAAIFEQGGWTLLDDLSGGSSGVPRSYARGISEDGSIIVGIGESDSGTEAFRYVRATGQMQGLSDIPGGRFASYAYGVSGNGAVVVGLGYPGQDDQEAFRWTEVGGLQRLGWLPMPSGIVKSSAANAANFDGSVIVGSSRSMDSPNGGEACVWMNGQPPIGLGDLPGGGFQSAALGVSGDGKVVVGRGYIDGGCGPFGCVSKPRAFIWTAQAGMRDLQELLTNTYGVPLAGWELREANGISKDGRVIVGTGLNPGGAVEAWMVTLPSVACYADCNGDGALGLADFGCFQTKFALGDPYADCNGDGVLGLADFGCFQTKFAFGCP